jgi:uncharacterized protein
MDGARLLRGWHGAADALLAARGRLDEANVFPVADGDTGTNMAATLAEAVRACRPEPHAGRLLDGLAAAALEASRGNSGIILAQFLGGLAAPLAHLAELGARDLAGAAGLGARAARAAVSDPVEGTVLSVMTAWAAALDAATAPGAASITLEEALATALAAAEAALAATPTQLGALAAAGVVDAGADGFVCLLRGFGAALALPAADTALPDPDAALPPPELDHHHHPLQLPGPPALRWCTEILLEDTHADADAVRARLADLGDSIIAAGHPPRLKAHLHTNAPEEAAARLAALGRLGPQKVEDMRLQYAAHHAPAAPVGLVTDSACDLPASLRDRFQVHQVPLTIQWGEHQYLDGRTLTAATCYGRLANAAEHPRTSQPPVARFERLYGNLLACHGELLSLHVSARLSGTLGAARLAAARAGGERIHCVDTRLVSAGLGLVVLGTAEAIAAGADATAAAAAASALAAHTEVFVVVDNLDALLRSGRLRPNVGRIARLSGLKPLVSLNRAGSSTVRGAAFSAAGLERALLRRLARNRRSAAALRWAVVHVAAEAAAASLAGRAAPVLGSPPAYVMETAPILGLHAGLGAVGLAVTWGSPLPDGVRPRSRPAVRTDT